MHHSWRWTPLDLQAVSDFFFNIVYDFLFIVERKSTVATFCRALADCLSACSFTLSHTAGLDHATPPDDFLGRRREAMLQRCRTELRRLNEEYEGQRQLYRNSPDEPSLEAASSSSLTPSPNPKPCLSSCSLALPTCRITMLEKKVVTLQKEQRRNAIAQQRTELLVDLMLRSPPPPPGEEKTASRENSLGDDDDDGLLTCQATKWTAIGGGILAVVLFAFEMYSCVSRGSALTAPWPALPGTVPSNKKKREGRR